MRNCRLCDEPMTSSPFTMCQACLKDSNTVRNLINKEPHLSFHEISQVTHVPLKKVKRLLQLGLKKSETL